jgi:hypothetical protein
VILSGQEARPRDQPRGPEHILLDVEADLNVPAA